MQPTEKHRETASEIVKAFGGIINAMPNEATIADFRDAACSVVSEALAKAEREGMKRAAEIVRAGREVSDPNDNYRSTIMVNWDDDDACADAILSQAGEA